MTQGVVHVIDDDDGVRDSLRLLLEATGFKVRAYSAAEDFLDGVDEAPPGCVVTDVRMPAMSGIELLEGLSDRLDRFPVIVLTGEADVPMAVAALKAGAQDFITKPYPADVIIKAVRTCHGRMVEQTDRSNRRAERAQRLAGLSAREREVLAGVMDGDSNKEIARKLEISPRTVEAYRANLMMKMGADSLSELVRMVLEARQLG